MQRFMKLKMVAWSMSYWYSGNVILSMNMYGYFSGLAYFSDLVMNEIPAYSGKREVPNSWIDSCNKVGGDAFLSIPERFKSSR